MTHATQHNGGKFTINPQFFGFDAEWGMRVVNMAKTIGEMAHSGAWADPRDRDVNGYPKQSAFTGGKASLGVLQGVCSIPRQNKRPGSYIVKWDGQALISCGFNGGIVALDTVSTGGTNNRMVVPPGPGDDDAIFYFNLHNVGVAGWSNLRICHADDEAMLDAGVIWHPIFLAKMNSFRPSAFRTLNWTYQNISNLSRMEYRKPVDYITWAGPTWIPNAAYGPTTNVDGDYSLTTGRGALSHREMLHCQFNASNPYTDIPCAISAANPMVVTTKGGVPHNVSAGHVVAFSGAIGPNLQAIPYYVLAAGLTATSFQVSRTPGGTPVSNAGDTSSNLVDVTRQPTFNRDGTGAKPLLTEYGTPLRADVNGPSKNTRTYQSTLLYDADNGCWLFWGNGRWDLGFSGDNGIIDGVPFEIMFDLCAEVGCHISMPAFVDGTYPSTGMHGQLAQLFKDWCTSKGITWMKFILEGPNEIWNWPVFGLTTTSRYIQRNTLRGGVPYDHHNPYGWAMTEIGQEVSGVFGADRTKYDIVCGVQTVGHPAGFDPRMNSDQWMAQGVAPSGYTLTPAKDWITAVCTAQYISSPLQSDAVAEGVLQAAYTSGDTKQLGRYLDTYKDGISIPATVPFVIERHTVWKAWAISHGIVKLIGYEGGYSPDYRIDSPSYTLRRDAKQYVMPSANWNGGIYHVLQTLYDGISELGTSGFTVENLAVFLLDGNKPSSNAWSIQEDNFDMDSPQLKCYSQMARGKRRYTVKVSG